MSTASSVLLDALQSTAATRAANLSDLAGVLADQLQAAGLLSPPPPAPCLSLRVDPADSTTLRRCDLTAPHPGVPHSNQAAALSWTDSQAAGALLTP